MNPHTSRSRSAADRDGSAEGRDLGFGGLGMLRGLHPRDKPLDRHPCRSERLLQELHPLVRSLSLGEGNRVDYSSVVPEHNEIAVSDIDHESLLLYLANLP